MDAKLPTNTFEDVMQLAIEGCKAVANYIREVRKFLLIAVDIVGLCLVIKFRITFVF